MGLNTNRLRVLRAGRRLSQLDLAVAIEMNANRYWRIENGYAVPTDDERDALANFFSVPVTDVFPVPDSHEVTS